MRFGIWFCLQEGFWIKSAVPVFDLEINNLLREKLRNYDNDIFNRKPKQEVGKENIKKFQQNGPITVILAA